MKCSGAWGFACELRAVADVEFPAVLCVFKDGDPVLELPVLSARSGGTRARPAHPRRTTPAGVMPALRTNMVRNVSEVWREGDWRCEFHIGGVRGEGRMLVYRGDSVVTAESGASVRARRGPAAGRSAGRLAVVLAAFGQSPV